MANRKTTYKRRRKNTKVGKVKGKTHFKTKTSSGKGTITLSTQGTKRIKKVVTPYKTKKNQRRILVIETITRVVK